MEHKMKNVAITLDIIDLPPLFYFQPFNIIENIHIFRKKTGKKGGKWRNDSRLPWHEV
jgi:hypothetical protein